MNTLEMRTRVGPDGVLTLSVPMGMSEANREVKVVVESAEDRVGVPARMDREGWAHFVAETAGSWKGELKRPEQGEFEVRDSWA